MYNLRTKYLLLVELMIGLSAGGCHRANTSGTESAPFIANFRTISFAVPARGDFHFATHERDRSFFVQNLCARVLWRNGRTGLTETVPPNECTGFNIPLMNEYGALVNVIETKPGERFSLFGERPKLKRAIRERPLHLIARFSMSKVHASEEWYYLSLLQTLYPTDYYTTDARWPIVACMNKNRLPPQVGSQCHLGFLIGDAFVAVMLSSKDDENFPPTQKEVFDAAVAVDDKLREISTPKYQQADSDALGTRPKSRR